MKKITICGKEYEISSNAYTRIIYKRTFGSGIFRDLKVLSEFANKQNDYIKSLEGEKLTQEEKDKKVGLFVLEIIDDFIEVIEQMAYALILTANPKINVSYESFLQGIEEINFSEGWIGEVTEMAVSSFRG